MSDGPPPAAAQDPEPLAPERPGWLARLLWREVGRRLQPALEREAAARAELGRRVEAHGAALADLRQAYLATRGEFEQVRDAGVPRLAAAVSGLSAAVTAVQREIESLRDSRIPAAEHGLAALQGTAEASQREIEALRDRRLPHAEADLDGLQHALDALTATLATVQGLAEEVRDRRLPALAARTDALVGRLHEELAAAAGLAERVARREPLHVAVTPAAEDAIPAAVAAASRSFADRFRGERREILGRAAEHAALLASAGPVLDVGCGRGELLEALRETGVAASGVDADPAMVAACRQLGLDASHGDALAVLRAVPPGTLGGVAAIHLIEHLPAAGWMALVEAAAAALRPGGLLLLESPNPESLRVGASLFWLDPTHRVPVHPEALAFVAKALGLEVLETRRLHPFPAEQMLVGPAQSAAVQALAARLDEWLSPPRDYLLVTRKP